MSHKVHRSEGSNIPFSWEKKPGVSKEMTQVGHANRPTNSRYDKSKLPPPPCRPEIPRATHVHDLQVPLPPCGFLPPPRSNSRKGLKKQDDPFLTAYRECTKSKGGKKGNKLIGSSKNDDAGFGIRKNTSIFSGFGIRRNTSIFSCKHSCSVRDDSMVMISRLPISKSQRERDEEGFLN